MLLDPLKEALRFAPVRPAVAAGVRAAVATVVPLIVGVALGRPELSWSSLAGFLAAIVDKGGAYRTRAAALLSFALGVAPLAALAGMVGGDIAPQIAAAFVAATVLGMSRVYSPGAASVGTALLILTLVSLAQPAPDVEHALLRGAWASAGAAWTAALALMVWPVRLYRPARAAIVRALRGVAVYADEVAVLPNHALTDADAARLRKHRALIRQALEDARATLAATRRGRRGDSSRGELLLEALEATDQTFASLVPLSELRAALCARTPWPAAHDNLTAALAALGTTLRAIAEVVDAEGASAPVPIPAALAAPPELAQGTHRGGDDHDVAHAEYRLAAELARRLAQSARRAADAALGLHTDRKLEPAAAPPTTTSGADTPASSSPRTTSPQRALAAPSRDPFAQLRAHLTLRSAVARHALRAGVTTALACGLAAALQLERGYWVTLAAASTLQPQLPATFLKVLQRVLGTVAGALIAALMTGFVDDPRVMLPIVFALTILSVSILPVNYALFAAFVTPTFLLLAESRTHDPTLVMTRIVDTLVGGAVALAGARLLWPASERDAFPAAAAAAIDAVRAHLRAFLDPSDAATRDAARREVGLSLLNAEASLQRWLAERRRAVELEGPMALLVFARAVASNALVLGATDLAPPLAAHTLTTLDGVLADLARAVAAQSPPQPLPDVTAPTAAARDPFVRERLERLSDAVRTMHAATTRWLGDPAARHLTVQMPAQA